MTLELVTHFNFALRLALHCFRACLQDIDLAVDAVFAPLDVHWALIVLLNDHGVLGQLCDIIITDGVAIALLQWNVDCLHATRLTWSCELHLD